MKRFLLLFLLTLVLFTFAENAFATSEEQPYKDVFITISTSSQGGGWYPFGGAIGAIWEKYLPGITVTVQTSAGTPHNLMLLEQKMAEIAFLTADIGYLKYEGIGDFEGKAYRGMRTLYNFMGGPLYLIVSEDSLIKTPLDLRGKRVGIGPLGGASLNIIAEALFDIYGLKEGDMSFFRGGRMDRAEALKDGRVDAGIFWVNLGSAVIMDLLASGFTIVPLTNEYVKKIVEKYPYYVGFTITKDSYNLAEDINSIGTIPFIACDASFDEDLAYNLTKTFFNHLNEIAEMYPPEKGLSIEDGIRSIVVPLHRGSEKFFMEKGLIQ
ncbi:MAG: TAXI family TRAP transporter solute-binding subunit [Candidatus Atribacteria bacterium]|nr:TAXI family TRAP transporter solute-binding subunit [Candidatus Atribacteria bacterium]